MDGRTGGDGAPARRRDHAFIYDRGRRPVGERIGAERGRDLGCETWLFWNESVDDVDPQSAIRYEVRVNGVFDGAQTGIDRWITYGTETSNTFSVQAVDSAGNRSPTSPVILTNQTC